MGLVTPSSQLAPVYCITYLKYKYGMYSSLSAAGGPRVLNAATTEIETETRVPLPNTPGGSFGVPVCAFAFWRRVLFNAPQGMQRALGLEAPVTRYPQESPLVVNNWG